LRVLKKLSQLAFVTGAGWAAHAGDYAVAPQRAQIFGVSVLRATIGVVHQSRLRPSLLESFLQGYQR